jgi:hypothetical protein
MSLHNDSPASKETSQDSDRTAPAIVHHDWAVNRKEPEQSTGGSCAGEYGPRFAVILR